MPEVIVGTVGVLLTILSVGSLLVSLLDKSIKALLLGIAGGVLAFSTGLWMIKARQLHKELGGYPVVSSTEYKLIDETRKDGSKYQYIKVPMNLEHSIHKVVVVNITSVLGAYYPKGTVIKRNKKDRWVARYWIYLIDTGEQRKDISYETIVPIKTSTK